MQNICDEIAGLVPESNRIEVRDRIAQLEQVVVLLASERSIEALIARLVKEREQAISARNNALAKSNESTDQAREARALLAVLIPYAASGIDRSCATEEEDSAAWEALQKAMALVPWHNQTKV